MAKPKPRWLKLDAKSRVRVLAGSTRIEIRLIIPSVRVRKQLESLKPKKK